MKGDAWWRPLVPFARPFRMRMIGLGSLSILLALTAAALPWPTKVAIDNVLAGKPFPGWLSWVGQFPGARSRTGQLVVLGTVSVALFLVRAFLVAVQQVGRRTTGQQMSFSLSGEVLAAVQRTSLVGLGRRPTGDVIQRVTIDSRCVDILFTTVVLGAFGSLVNLLVMLTIATQINWKLGAVALLGALPMLFMSRRFSRPMMLHSLAMANAEGAVVATAERTLSALPEIQSFAAEDVEQRRFTEAVRQRLQSALRVQKFFLGFQLSIGTMIGLGTASVLLVGGLQSLDGRATVGELLVVSTYVGALFGPIAARAMAAAWARPATAAIGPKRAPTYVETTRSSPTVARPSND